MRNRFPPFVALAAVCVAACGKSNEPVGQAPSPSFLDSVTVSVQNNNYYDANVYALYRGQARRRLGTVRGNQQSETFMLPWHPRDLFFVVDLVVGPGVFQSTNIVVDPGDEVLVTLPPEFATSVFFRQISR